MLKILVWGKSCDVCFSESQKLFFKLKEVGKGWGWGRGWVERGGKGAWGGEMDWVKGL